MTTHRPLVCLAAAAAMYLAADVTIAGQQTSQQLTVKFSDPSRPGRIDLDLILGGVTIRGASRQDVLIEAHARAEGTGPERKPSVSPRGRAGDDPPPAGLRRLTQTPGFEVEEQRNVIAISGGVFGRGLDFDIQVPSRTNLKLNLVNEGVVVVNDVEGEFEIENVNGSISLANVAGAVVAHSVNGKVAATMARVTPDKPMAFTSLNGSVDVTLPAAVKAVFKLRSDHGDVFTDFDMQMRPAPPPQETRRDGGRYRIEVNNAVYGSINGGGPEYEMRSFNGNVYVRKGR